MRTFVVCAVVACALTACQGGTGPLPLADRADATSPVPAGAALLGPNGLDGGKIQHVVIIMQENRSFNNLFYGYPGALTTTYGYASNGKKITLQPMSMLSRVDVLHTANGFFAACNGTGKIPGTNCRMNGFDQESVTCGGAHEPPCPIPHPQYSYVPRSESAPYFSMASQYVLGDEMFPSNMDNSSFISHQYIISGQAEHAINYPSGDWGCPGAPNTIIARVGNYRQFPNGYEVPCWDPKTLGDELDAAGLSWAFYAQPTGRGGIWSAYQAIKHIYRGPDWTNNILSPSTRFLRDIAAGNLRAVTWITPSYKNSDHVGSGSDTGPSWVTSLVNAIGQSPYWNTTAIFIFWDESGGLYDPVPPQKLDFDGVGIRVPLLVISPYAKKGYVSHVHYEHGSILKFIEQQFGLGTLAASDQRANSPAADCFNFNQPPRAFVPIQAPDDRAFFLRQPTDTRPPDDN